MKKLLVLLLLLVCIPAIADTSLSGAVKIYIEHDYTDDTTLGNPRDAAQIKTEQLFTAGSGSETAVIDLLWYGQRTIASGSNESLDLAGGISDVFGNVITFARIKSLYIRNLSTAQTLTLGNGANPWPGPFSPATSTFTIPPLGVIAWEAPYFGWAVTAGTGDTLKLANGSGATMTYNISILGSSD